MLAFFADPKILVANTRQGILNGAQKLAVGLMQLDMRRGVGFTGGDVGRVPAKVAGGGHRFGQPLAGGEFLPLRKEEILIPKQFIVVHDRRPAPHDNWEGLVPLTKLYSQTGAAASRFSFLAAVKLDSVEVSLPCQLAA
jgi:hypothetical protein